MDSEEEFVRTICEEEEDSELHASNKDVESTKRTGKGEDVKGKHVKTSISIDVTKALLLLGLPTWKSLEPDNEKGNASYVEAKLNKVVEEKLAERREYLDLINETKKINYDLYLKMVEADEKRIDALCQKEKKKTSEPQQLMLPIFTKASQPLRRCKSHRGRRTLKKSNTFTEESLGIAMDSEMTVPKEDDEEVALTWAFTILMKEFHRRNEYRDETKLTIETVKKKTNDKLEALFKFRKMKALKKKEEKKNNKDRKRQEMLKAEALSQAAESLKSAESKKSDTNKEGENESGGIKKRGSFKRKVQVVSLQDQIESKRKPVAEEVNTSSKQLLYQLKTEKEKVDEAKRVLTYLKEKQRIRYEIESLQWKNTGISKEVESKEEDAIEDVGKNNEENTVEEMKPGSSASSVASSTASSRKGSKKKFFSNMKKKVKRTTSDPVTNQKGNLLEVRQGATTRSPSPSRQLLPRSPVPPRRQLSRTISAPPGKTSTTPPSSMMTNRRKNSKSSRKNSTSSRMSSDANDDDSNDSSQFSTYVQNSLGGLICSKEDEDIIKAAIEQTLLENNQSNTDNPMIGNTDNPMIVVVDGSETNEEQEKRNPEKYQKFSALSRLDNNDVSLDDINMAAEDVPDAFHKDDSYQSAMAYDHGSEALNDIEELRNAASNQSNNLNAAMNDEDTRDSTDTFYSLKEESDEDKDDSKSSGTFSFERSFNLLSTKK